MLARRLVVTLFAAALLSSNVASAQQYVIKAATVAPEGSVWLKVMRRMDKELQKKTGGRLKFKFYAGGVLGDDKVVLQKMRFGQIQAAGLTGVGLGELVPKVRLMELPFQLATYRQVDCALKSFYDEFEKAFESKGFVLLGWTDQGFVYLFSKEKVQSVDDLRIRKPWVWEADPLARAMYEVVGVSPVPLALQDVFTSLQTGHVDTVYISPVAAISLQWYTKVNYMIDLPIADGSGAFVVSKGFFDKLPQDLQSALLETARKYLRKLSRATRKLNDKSLRILQKKGVTIIPVDAARAESFRKLGLRAAKKLVGKLYSAQDLERFLQTVSRCRK